MPTSTVAKAAGSGTGAVVLALTLSTANSVFPVRVKRLNVPEKLAKPSPLNSPEGTAEVKFTLPTAVVFSKAARVTVLGPPTVAKWNVMPVRFAENDSDRGPDSVAGPHIC